jgi:hypothetical protein
MSAAISLRTREEAEPRRRSKRDAAIGFDVVVFRDGDGIAHLPSPSGGPLTRCKQIALLRLTTDRLYSEDCVCPGCALPRPKTGKGRRGR